MCLLRASGGKTNRQCCIVETSWWREIRDWNERCKVEDEGWHDKRRPDPMKILIIYLLCAQQYGISNAKRRTTSRFGLLSGRRLDSRTELINMTIEKAFLKQPKGFLCSKKAAKGNKPDKGGNRFWKNNWPWFQDSQGSHRRYEKRHSNIPAHISPCFRVKEGDHVIIGQCRPLSKTVRFNVLKVIPVGSQSGAVKKAFTAA